MATKKEISEMVLFKLAGGWPDVNFQIDERDIFDALEHKVNEKFRLRHFDSTLPSGETLPENAMIATYTGNTVTSTLNRKSTATLPVIPIALPKNMGIYLVYDPNYPDVMFVPLQRGQVSLLKVDTLLNDLGGEIGYEPKNNIILFNRDLTLLGITSVTMELCVFDISQYSLTQELPIPSDMVGIIEDELVKEFAPVTPESGIVNPFSNANQKANP